MLIAAACPTGGGSFGVAARRRDRAAPKRRIIDEGISHPRGVAAALTPRFARDHLPQDRHHAPSRHMPSSLPALWAGRIS
jgi:hypothetical protein